MKLVCRRGRLAAEGGLTFSSPGKLWLAEMASSTTLVIDPDGKERCERNAPGNWWLHPLMGREWGQVVIRWREP